MKEGTDTKRDSTVRASRSHALRGNAYRKALPSICESRSPYAPHACMCPTTEAEPLKTHSQAEPGNERFSILSRFMSMAVKEEERLNALILDNLGKIKGGNGETGF